MLEELNNILDRTNSWIVFEEARNSGLIALNLGFISFVFDTLLFQKQILLTLGIISIIIAAYSFIGKKLPVFFKIKSNDKKEEVKDDSDKIMNISKEEKIQDKEDTLFIDSRIVIKRNKNIENNQKRSDIEKKDLSKYSSKNIYNYKDVSEIDEETLLLLVHERLLKRNEKEEYPININKEYQFKLAHRDLSKMIHENSQICMIKSKCFFVSLGLFIVNIIFLGIGFLIY